MLQKLLDHAAELGIHLTEEQQQQLLTYALVVWDKHGFLNLTGATGIDEIITRHLCDGLTAARALQEQLPAHAPLQLADVGAGCGYIGFVLAVVFEQAHVTLIDSLERRCNFMNWAALKAGITNCTVKNLRVTKQTELAFDAVTERAVGPLPDILPFCLQIVKPGGIFLAFQGAQPQIPTHPQAQHLYTGQYTLPCDKRPRYLVVFKKEYV